jgi:hypothetical protein
VWPDRAVTEAAVARASKEKVFIVQRELVESVGTL